jgi:hypothetical protein
MNLVQMLPLATLSITLSVALFHTYAYVRQLGSRTNLSFAAVCLYMCLLALVCLMNYNVSRFDEHLFWLMLFYVSFPLFPAAFIHFTYDFIGRDSHRIPWMVTGVCLLEMVIMGILCLTSSEEKAVAIPVEFLDFAYVAFEGSLAMEAMKLVVLATAYIVILPALNLIVRSYRAGNRAAGPILIGALLFLLSGINDTLVETHVYSFLFLAYIWRPVSYPRHGLCHDRADGQEPAGDEPGQGLERHRQNGHRSGA